MNSKRIYIFIALFLSYFRISANEAPQLIDRYKNLIEIKSRLGSAYLYEKLYTGAAVRVNKDSGEIILFAKPKIEEKVLFLPSLLGRNDLFSKISYTRSINKQNELSYLFFKKDKKWFVTSSVKFTLGKEGGVLMTFTKKDPDVLTFLDVTFGITFRD